MALLKDTTVSGTLAIQAASSATHAVRSDDSRMSDARTPTAHGHDVEDISGLGTAAVLNVAVGGNAAAGQVVKGNDGRLSDARTPTGHGHAHTDISGLGTAAVLDVPASGSASAGQVVKGDDARLSDARTPTTHTHSDATESASGFLSAADKIKLDNLSGQFFWLEPIDTFNNLPVTGDPLNAVRIAADTGIIWFHSALTGTVVQQWTQPPASVATTLFIGTDFRIVAQAGGAKLQCRNSANTWVDQISYAEA